MNRITPFPFLLGLCLVAANLAAQVQQYAIEWFTIDGGGGYSSGGSYELSGTIAQSVPGLSSGGNYTLKGDFWAGESIDDPEIHIGYATATTTRLWWPSLLSGFILQVNTGLNNPNGWTNVGVAVTDDGTNRSVTVSSVNSARFYRLRKK